MQIVRLVVVAIGAPDIAEDIVLGVGRATLRVCRYRLAGCARYGDRLRGLHGGNGRFRAAIKDGDRRVVPGRDADHGMKGSVCEPCLLLPCIPPESST